MVCQETCALSPLLSIFEMLLFTEWEEVTTFGSKTYTTVGPQAPQSALPIGATSSVDPVRLVEILPSSEIVHSLLGVSHAKTPENILDSNLAGFLYVYMTSAFNLIPLQDRSELRKTKNHVSLPMPRSSPFQISDPWVFEMVGVDLAMCTIVTNKGYSQNEVETLFTNRLSVLEFAQFCLTHSSEHLQNLVRLKIKFTFCSKATGSKHLSAVLDSNSVSSDPTLRSHENKPSGKLTLQETY
jgi:hypothetical protein